MNRHGQMALMICLLIAPTEQGCTKPRSKNIILMISDGCGFNQVDAASLYQHGVTGKQVYEFFPVKYGMSTVPYGGNYDPDLAWRSFDQVLRTEQTDSAAAATAMASGIKTYNGAIGVDIGKLPLVSFMARAEGLGRATGVVTTVQFTHATPAGFVAHNVARSNYAEIANEMIYESPTDVIMGAGHPLYNNDNEPVSGMSPDDPRYRFVGGLAAWTDMSDGRVTGNDADGDQTRDDWRVIQSRSDFQNLMDDPNPPARVLGLAQVYSTVQQERGGDGNAAPYGIPLNQNVPTLEEMTRGALNVLSRDPDGFVVMIEGGAVDWASHDNQSGRAIEEQVDFNRAVEAVVNWIESRSSWQETLLIITSDHETGYLTGPDSGSTDSGPQWNPLVNRGAGNVPGMMWNSGGHSNSLVPFYAKGQGADLFHPRALGEDPVRGKYLDNTDIAKVIFQLLGGIGP